MHRIFWILFFPITIFPQAYNTITPETFLRVQDSLLLSNLTITTSSYQTPLSQRRNFKKLIQLFKQKRYSYFLKESNAFQRKHSLNTYSNELLWLNAHALLQTGDSLQAKQLLLTLTNNSNLVVRHQALLDLYQIHIDSNQNASALLYLKQIQDSPLDSPYKELAHAKYIYLLTIMNEPKQVSIFQQSFEYLYPNSVYLYELQYFTALHSVLQGDITKAKEYAHSLLSKETNIAIQRLMGEIALQEKDYNKSLSYFLPISKTRNNYQDEGLYKSALLYKHLKEYQKAHPLLKKLITYHQNSLYFERASTELASINIILKNYDDALEYYLRESGYTGTRKAFALLKITEINFLKTNTLATIRTGNRIQQAFPYSAYANEALYWIGRSYLYDEEFQKSIKTFDDYLIREPQSPKKDEILIFLGHAHASLDNQAKARFYFQEIINYSPNEALKRQALLGLGRSYNINEPKRSLEYFDRVWKVWPTAQDSAKALYYSAAVRYNLRENKESLRLFQQLIKKFPNSSFHQDALLAVAKLEFKSEKFNNILDSDDIILTADNKELVSEFKELQARSLFRIGDYEKALPLFQESLELTDNKIRQIDLFLAEASTLRSLDKHREAVKKYEKYLNALKKSGDVNNLEELLWAEIAFSYLEIKKPVKAQKVADSMLKKFPHSTYLSDIYFRLADGYFADTQYKKAILYYNKTQNVTDDPSIISEALLREAWSMNENRHPNTQKTFELFLERYPTHFGVPDIMFRLAELQDDATPENSNKLRNQIITEYPSSLEAEESRLYFAKQLNSNNSMEEFYEALSQTSDTQLKAKYLYKLGSKLKEENDTANALQIFLDIHRLRDPVHGADALFEAADLLTKQDKYQESLKLYINIIAQYDEKYYAPALGRIIQLYIFLEDYDNAERFKIRLLEQYPESKESKEWS